MKNLPDSPLLHFFGQPKVNQFDGIVFPIFQHDVLNRDTCPLK